MSNESHEEQQPVGGASLEAARREKLRKIKALGFDPFGSRFDDHQPIGEIRARETEVTREASGEGGEPEWRQAG